MLAPSSCDSLSSCPAPGEDTVGVLKEVGGVQDVLRAMRSRPGDREIVINCCSLLWTFALTGHRYMHTCTHAHAHV